MNQTLIMRQEKYWFSVLPSGWQKGRIKDVFNQISNNGTNLEEGTYIPLENLESYTGKLIRRVNNENNETTNLFRKGDILLNKLRPYLAKVHLAEFNGGVSGEVIVLRTSAIWKRYTSNKYFFYLFLSSAFINKINSMSEGVKMPRTNPSKILALEIAIPSLEEQTAIAEYLDTKTQAIDKKVSLLEKKIGYYQELRKSLINETVTKGLDKNVKLKDSGIDWIGQIPEHWEVKRLKDCFHLFTGNSISDKSGFENPVDSIPYVATKDIDFYTGKITYDNGIYIPIVDKSFKRAKPNTTLICIEGANAGKKIGFTEQKVAFVNKLCAIKRNNQINYDKYLYYFTQTNLFNSQFFSLLNGLIGGVSVSLIRQLNVLIPSKDEQVEIVEYLDSRLSQIDQIITNIQAQITTLKELRKTLINDVVTGKIKVNNE
jgi:type I restriction enzyme S subunit